MGVLGGLGHYFRIDPNLIRLGFVFGAIITGVLPFSIAYLIAAVVMTVEPAKHPQLKIKRMFRPQSGRRFGGVLIAIANYARIDPVVVRLGFIFLLFATALAPGLIWYFVAWGLIPEK